MAYWHKIYILENRVHLMLTGSILAVTNSRPMQILLLSQVEISILSKIRFSHGFWLSSMQSVHLNRSIRITSNDLYFKFTYYCLNKTCNTYRLILIEPSKCIRLHAIMVAALRLSRSLFTPMFVKCTVISTCFGMSRE